jgi:hypothetical protein
MKVLFLLDDDSVVAVGPEKLQIRQIQPGVSALGIEVTIPLNGADGKPELNEDGTPKTQQGFRPFVNYNVNLSAPAPAEAPATPVAVPVKAAEEAQPVNGKAKPATKAVAKVADKGKAAKKKA